MTTTTIRREDLCLPSHGCVIICLGPSGVGKTTLIAEIISNAEYCFTAVPPHKWLMIYRYEQKAYKTLKEQMGSKIEFMSNYKVGDLERIESLRGRNEESPLLGVVLDDEAEAAGRDPTVLRVASGGAHHTQILFILLSQHPYLSDIQRYVMRQASYVIIYQNLKHQTHARKVSTEIFGHAGFLQDVHRIMRAKRGPHGAYALLDMRPSLINVELCCRSGPPLPEQQLYYFTPDEKNKNKAKIHSLPAPPVKKAIDLAATKEQEDKNKRRETLLLNLRRSSTRDSILDGLKGKQKKKAIMLYEHLIETQKIGINEDGETVYLEKDGEIGSPLWRLVRECVKPQTAKERKKSSRSPDLAYFGDILSAHEELFKQLPGLS
jgi:hypothetical protein